MGPEVTAEYANKDGVPRRAGGRVGCIARRRRSPRPASGSGRARVAGPLPRPTFIGEGGMGLVFEAEDTDLLRSLP